MIHILIDVYHSVGTPSVVGPSRPSGMVCGERGIAVGFNMHMYPLLPLGSVYDTFHEPRKP